MAKTRGKPESEAGQLLVRLDGDSKTALVKAAGLRRISLSDYVRQVAVPQAKREIASAEDRTVSLTPEEQLAFWTALSAPPELTPAQKELGKLMRANL